MASPQLKTLLAALATRQGDRFAAPVEEMRHSLTQMVRVFPAADDVRIEPLRAGGVPAERLWIAEAGAAEEAAGVRRQAAAPLAAGPLLLYLHGGAYVTGSAFIYRDLASRLARAAGAQALVPDYRLAPEHPFPAAVEDAVAAYRWLLAQGVDPRRLALAGDSAGGGLVLATLLEARRAGEPLPAAAVCLSPWVDMEALGESMTERAAVDPMIQRPGLLRMARLYLGGTDPRHPLAAPLYADLAGLPPLLVQVGEAETLLDDARRLARRAEAAGVEAELQVFAEMIHGWHLFARLLPEGRQAIDAVGAFLRRKWGAGTA